ARKIKQCIRTKLYCDWLAILALHAIFKHAVNLAPTTLART
ncbi:22737_t:CDS:1, partial [Gigaspora margarita]